MRYLLIIFICLSCSSPKSVKEIDRELRLSQTKVIGTYQKAIEVAKKHEVVRGKASFEINEESKLVQFKNEANPDYFEVVQINSDLTDAIVVINSYAKEMYKGQMGMIVPKVVFVDENFLPILVKPLRFGLKHQFVDGHFYSMEYTGNDIKTAKYAIIATRNSTLGKLIRDHRAEAPTVPASEEIPKIETPIYGYPFGELTFFVEH